MRTPIALLASTALIVPAAVLAAPAGAGDVQSDAAISNCSTTRHGVTVRIKLRMEDRFMRVRVSHPRGTGNFTQRRVERVRLTAFRVSPIDRTRGTQYGDSPVYRLRKANAVDVKFALRNGRSISLSCMYPATFPPCPTPEPGSDGAVC